MENFDLEQFFYTKPFKPNPPAHSKTFLQMFFEDRRISDNKISKYFKDVSTEKDVSAMQVGNWLNGRVSIPKKRRVQLEQLKQLFLDWEKVNGRRFNTPDYECPYSEYNAEFGRDYDEYEECMGCAIRLDCEGNNTINYL